MEMIWLETVERIKENFPNNLEEVEQYINTKITSLEIKLLAIANDKLFVQGILTIENPEDICWRRAKRVLNKHLGNNAFIFHCPVDKVTGIFEKPRV